MSSGQEHGHSGLRCAVRCRSCTGPALGNMRASQRTDSGTLERMILHDQPPATRLPSRPHRDKLGGEGGRVRGTRKGFLLRLNGFSTEASSVARGSE